MNRRPPRHSIQVEMQAGQGDDSSHHFHTESEFGIVVHHLEAARTPGQKVQGEVDHGYQHEKDGDPFEHRVLKMADAGVMRRQPAQGNGGKAVADGVEGAHPGQPVRQKTRKIKPDVNQPQILGGLGDPGRQLLIFHRPRRRSPVKLHTADAQHRQQSHRQHDDSDPAQEMQLRPVVQNRLGHSLQPGERGRAGGGQAGNGLEHRIHQPHVRILGQHERQSAQQRRQDPERHYQNEPVPVAQINFELVHRQPTQQAQPQRCRHRLRERHDQGIAVVPPGHRHWRQHGGAEQHHQHPDHV